MTVCETVPSRWSAARTLRQELVEQGVEMMNTNLALGRVSPSVIDA